MMASATNATPPTNSTAGTHPPTFNGSRDGQARQTKTGNMKMTDRGRKESPVDPGRRPPQKAWTAGANPLTQRANPATQLNGNTAQTKSNPGTKSVGQKEGGMNDKQSHDRSCYILGAMTGLSVIYTARSGEKFEGIVAGTSLLANNSKITLRMTKKLIANTTSQPNGVMSQEATLVGTSPDFAMTFDLKDMADLSISQFSLPESARQANGTAAAFQTDTDISNNVARGADRPLEKWMPDGPDEVDFSLGSGNIGTWDQFETHKKKFGGVSTYNENLYTTAINRSAPGFARRDADARRIAQEINNEQSTNTHIREERGQTNEGELEDEEDKYSGVRRGEKVFPPLPVGGVNKYTPPARRVPGAQPTLTGAPVDSAIISAQLSKPNVLDTAASNAASPVREAAESLTTPAIDQPRKLADTAISAERIEDAVDTDKLAAPAADDSGNKSLPVNTSISPQRKPNVDNPTEDVENKVLDQFRHFANVERQRFAERKREKASQDRTAKLNDLLRFSKTFKLKTPVPTDLVGILAKDPAKQEAIIEKAQKEHEEAKSTPSAAATPSKVSSSAAPVTVPSNKTPTVPKFDASQIPAPIPERATFNRARGGYSQHGTRNERVMQQSFGSRGTAPFPQRTTSQQERKPMIPAPISLADGRLPPAGPMADQNPSPQRSTVHTPTSAASSRFNAKAMEFRPNVNAPAFNPSASSNAPSSPASVQRAASISRTASPSSFFGTRKPKPSNERVSVTTSFDPIYRMKKEQERRKSEKADEPFKDYSFNGGIPNAYHTAPTWTVKEENVDKKYQDAFSQPLRQHASPHQSRSSSSQHGPFSGQMPATSNGMGVMSHMSTPQPHGPPGNAYGHYYDEHRMPMPGASPQVYPSPGMAVRQMSNFSSPMPHQAQPVYGQQFYGSPAGQVPMQMRQFPNTPGMMHAQPGQMTAPLMLQQQSSGPYMSVPQQYNQMPMYSPNPNHVYPQPQTGYPSPGRMAPIMMHQGSQQGHHNAQPMMYAVPTPGAPMMYTGQPGQMMGMRPAFAGHPAQYGSSPHQAHHMQQRAMSSSGYGSKAMQQAVPQGQGPPANAPQQPAAFGQVEMGREDSK